MKFLKQPAALALMIVLLAVPLLTLAAPGDLYPPPITTLPGGSQATNNTVGYWVLYVINILLGVTGIIAVLFLIVGGFRYITSAGNAEAAEGAKKIILNAIIGLVVIILSYVIVTVIISALGQNRV